MSQQKAILKHLLDGRAITPLEALNQYGSLRLGAVIFDLRKQGVPIETETVINGRKHYARYFIKHDDLFIAKLMHGGAL